MCRPFKISILLLFSFLITSCGTPMPGEYRYANTYRYERPDKGMAIIYIYHRKSHVEAPCYVWENDKKVGVIKSGTYFMRSVRPGSYTYMATNDSYIKSPVTVDVEEGKETFLEVRQEVDFLMAHPYVDVVSRETARALLPGLKSIIYTP
jgi:hypothetical protein